MLDKILYFFIKLYCKIRDRKKYTYSQGVDSNMNSIRFKIGEPPKPRKKWQDFINELHETKKSEGEYPGHK